MSTILWLSAYFERHIQDTTSILLAVTTLALIISSVRYLILRAKRVQFPVIGNHNDVDFRDALEYGVSKYPESPFFIPDEKLTLIVPKSAVNDIKSFTDDYVSLQDALSTEFYPEVTGLFNEYKTLITVVKNDISRQIANSLTFLQDEATYSFDRELGPCEEWTPFTLYPTLARIVALVSSRVFVGRPLSRDPEWVDVTVDYAGQMIKAKYAIKETIPSWLSWSVKIVGPHLKDVKSLYNFRNRAASLVKPILEAQLAKEGNEKLYSVDGDEEGNGIAWFLARMDPNNRLDSRQLTQELLGLSFAAIHTTTITVTHALFDLAAYREYIPLLLEEIETVILEDGYETTEDGHLRMRKSSMPKLAKLDSFLKESQRMNPLGLGSHFRITTSDVKFSSGHFVPKGTRIIVPSWVIHKESSALQAPGLTKSLSEFDGLRFFNLRRLPGNENRHLFVSTSADSLAFGHGNHSCPGRFFASNEIKLILIEALRHWDFRFPDDEKLNGGIWTRPKNIYKKFECYPDTGARMEFRRRKRI